MATEFSCSRCNVPATKYLTHQILYAAQALRAPYFLCGECRLMYISRQLVRKAATEWWRRNNWKKMPFSFVYGRLIDHIQESVIPYHAKIGYKMAHFTKLVSK